MYRQPAIVFTVVLLNKILLISEKTEHHQGDAGIQLLLLLFRWL